MTAPDGHDPAAALPAPKRKSFMGRMRNYLLTGLLVIAPSAVTVWVLIRLFNAVDNLLGRYLRFAALDYRRIPGAGLVATMVVLLIVGWIASWIGSRSLFAVWEQWLSRIPGIGILYGSTKSLGEAFLGREKRAFQRVVLIQWPYPGVWRVGFVAGPPSPQIRSLFAEEIEVVFVPHTPNPASGFVHYAPKKDLRYLDWSVEEALKVVVSGGLVQPGAS
jgi:uncharacterized membrane protein